MTPKDVLAANQAFYRAFETMDLEAMGTVWSKGTNCICVHPGRSAIRGWEQIRLSWEQVFKHTNRMEIKTEIVSTEVSDSLAYVIVVEKLVQTLSDQPMEAQGVATNLFERMGGGWYLLHRHSSPILQPIAPPTLPQMGQMPPGMPPQPGIPRFN